MAITRYYLPWTGSTPSVIPVAEFWTFACTSPSAPVVRSLSTVRSSSDSILLAGSSPPGGGIQDTLAATYVSDPLPSGSVEGDFRYVAAGQGTSSGGVTIQLRVRVVDNTGATRGVLYAGHTATTVSTDPTAENYGLATGTSMSASRSRRLSGTFTPVVAVAGDRLVVEVGTRILTGNSGSRYANLVVGNDSDVTEHNFVVDEAPGVGWFEWDAPDPPNVPTGLVNISATDDSLGFDWVAPATGDPAMSYDVRVDGGAHINIGNVTDHVVTGLTFETEYTFEVRSVNSAGTSAWVSTTGTTLETVPGPPQNLLMTDASSTSLIFEWEPPVEGSAPDEYEQRLDGGAPAPLGLVTTDDVTGLEPETTYLYEVRAVNAVGPSPWVSESAQTLAAPAPPPGTFGVEWDKADERYYIHGVDRGVLYISGKDPVAWNGIIGIDETGDASRSILYRDGQIYLADFDPGDFEGSINAFFYPDAFSECLGIPEVADGFYVDNQKPKRFGLSYRSLIGSGSAGDMFGYQIHLVYNAVLQIGTRAHKTKTNQVGLMEMSFDMVATPVKLPGMRPTAHYIIDTRNMSQATLDQLEQILYGNGIDPGSLPNPAELFDLLNFGSAITFVDHGDGTWTASGSYANVHFTEDGNIEILNVNGVDNGDGTYLLQDTP